MSSSNASTSTPTMCCWRSLSVTARPDTPSSMRLALPTRARVMARSAPGARSLAVGPQIDDEGQDDEEPLEPRHMVSGSPVVEGRIRERRPRQHEEAQERDDPTVERAAQDVAREPHQHQGEPGGDECEE